MINEHCPNQMENLLLAMLRGELPADQAAAVSEHLDLCPHCLRLLEAIQAVEEGSLRPSAGAIAGELLHQAGGIWKVVGEAAVNWLRPLAAPGLDPAVVRFASGGVPSRVVAQIVAPSGGEWKIQIIAGDEEDQAGTLCWQLIDEKKEFGEYVKVEIRSSRGLVDCQYLEMQERIGAAGQVGIADGIGTAEFLGRLGPEAAAIPSDLTARISTCE